MPKTASKSAALFKPHKFGQLIDIDIKLWLYEQFGTLCLETFKSECTVMKENIPFIIKHTCDAEPIEVSEQKYFDDIDPWIEKIKMGQQILVVSDDDPKSVVLVLGMNGLSIDFYESDNEGNTTDSSWLE